MIRKNLQAGFGRGVGGLIVFAGGFYALFGNWDSILSAQINPLDAVQKVAFVAAAFSVTAYNLRTRVVDLILKIEGSPSRITQLCMVGRECGRKLTNLVVLFTVTAFLMGCCGFFSTKVGTAARWYASLTAGLFGGSVVQFLYVLFAFERLERFMLDDAETRARQKEADRLTNP